MIATPVQTQQAGHKQFMQLPKEKKKKIQINTWEKPLTIQCIKRQGQQQASITSGPGTMNQQEVDKWTLNV